MRPCERVELDFIETAPDRFRNSVFGPVLNLALRRFLRNLRTYTDTRFATQRQR